MICTFIHEDERDGERWSDCCSQCGRCLRPPWDFLFIVVDSLFITSVVVFKIVQNNEEKNAQSTIKLTGDR